MKRIEYIIMIVGAGGTGGNFAKEFARYMAYFKEDGRTIKTVLIDGDKVEQKNQERQPFMEEDVQQPKALALGSAITETFGLDDFYNYPHYITCGEELDALFRKLSSYNTKSAEGMSIPVVIGCVDNHRARQSMHSFFGNMKNLFYFDAANEYSVGEVVLAAKIDGLVISPDRAFYYPDILTDTSPGAQEASCGAVNVTAPQHLATNLMAANLLLDAAVTLLSDNAFKGGIIYFDRKAYFSRFQPFKKEGREMIS